MSPFLAVQISLWPVLISFGLFSLLGSVVLWVNQTLALGFVLWAFGSVCLISYLWFKDFLRESVIGYHTHNLEMSLRLGMLLFILSEVFFFVSFFWAFYDAALLPVVEIGLTWPPKGVVPLVVYSVPLLNTVILLSSGLSVTWAHHALISNSLSNTSISLGITVLLGVYFLVMQYAEYCESQFAISDGVYGSTFFIATGFHGIHVLIGTTFLFVVLVHTLSIKLTSVHHFSFEAAAWYWHFVDVVWLILFVSIYWWGSL